jgi:hypothetical protein
MTLTDMRALVRRDLHDEDNTNYRWTDNELDRQIARVVKEFSEKLPLEQKATLATTSGSREISIATLTDLIMVEAVEYSVGLFPAVYQRYALWNDTLTLLGEEIPDGSNCYIYYGKLHTLDISSSTIPGQFEDLIATGACAYAALQYAVYSINRINTGGTETILHLQQWGLLKESTFRAELKRLGRTNKVRIRQLYTPCYQVKSQTTDWGP